MTRDQLKDCRATAKKAWTILEHAAHEIRAFEEAPICAPREVWVNPEDQYSPHTGWYRVTLREECKASMSVPCECFAYLFATRAEALFACKVELTREISALRTELLGRRQILNAVTAELKEIEA